MTLNVNFRVNALIIGAGRSGTTSLCDTIARHPQICYSTIKEVNYFSIDSLYRRGESYFHSLFECDNKKVVATADTYLLAAQSAIQRIYAYNPDIKLIVLLRDPVSRAFSSYNYSVNYGHHEKYYSFIDSIESEKGIKANEDLVEINNLGHFYCSLYGKHLLRWADVFGKDQLLILKTRDMANNPNIIAKQITDFLEIDQYKFEFEKQNVNAVPRSRIFERLLINRDSILRKSIRNLMPRKIKQKIFKSGLVEKVHNVNRNPQKAASLTEEEQSRAFEYFKNDLDILEKEFGITL